MFEGVLRADLQGNIVLANKAAAELFGYDSAQEMYGLNMDDLYAEPETRKLDKQELQRKGKLHNLNFPFRRKDGTTGWSLCNIKFFTDEENQILGTEGLLRDISELKNMEQKLALAQKLESIGQLASGIAHEINTPMQYIVSNLTFLQDNIPALQKLIAAVHAIFDDGATWNTWKQQLSALDETNDYTDLIRESNDAIRESLEGTTRITDIVKAMKCFAHNDQGQKSAMDMNQAIHTTLIIAKNEWKYCADASTDLDPDLPHIMCCAGDINQVLLNLIVNAAHTIEEKYKNSDLKGRITISTSCEMNQVQVTISDTGCGIPEKHQQHIFDPFYTTKEVGKGTGQGLAICYAIIKKHGGQIRFTTEQGNGTTFTVLLPLAQP
ncbi:MAG: PAS domain S-box protein [Spartobacteria bacterium]|nr:PAS domain S-box protein [Spartobacteria bacterium]